MALRRLKTMTHSFFWWLAAVAACFACLESSAFGCDYSIIPKTFDFRGHPIAYELAQQRAPEAVRVQNIEAAGTGKDGRAIINSPFSDGTGGVQEMKPNKSTSVVAEEPILLLNGFGVGSFHQHRLIPYLLDSDNKSNQRSVYCMDYLGQGKSWPSDCDDGCSQTEQGLRYCVYTWSDQIIQFIEDVILPSHPNVKKVHICGNSVGGHISVIIALQRPDLISTITLLNATPVWGLNLPFWSGHLPAPAVPKWIGNQLFNLIRDESTITKYLDTAYSRREAFDDKLVKDIRECTEISKGGHAAFSSILWSPPAKFPELGASDFNSMLEKLQCDVLLIFGRDDPWCTPAFGRSMARTLSMRGTTDDADESASPWSQYTHRYVELDDVGHCPNHESPQAVAKVLGRWVGASSGQRGRESLTLIKDEEDSVTQEPWGVVRLHEVEESEIRAKPTFLDSLVTKMVG